MPVLHHLIYEKRTANALFTLQKKLIPVLPDNNVNLTKIYGIFLHFNTKRIHKQESLLACSSRPHTKRDLNNI